MKKYFKIIYRQFIKGQFEQEDVITFVPTKLPSDLLITGTEIVVPLRYSHILGLTKRQKFGYILVCIIILLAIIPISVTLLIVTLRGNITNPPTDNEAFNSIIYILVNLLFGYLILSYMRFYKAVRTSNRNSPR